MNVKLLVPKNGVAIPDKKGIRIYFLGGPISGGGNWQRKAIEMIAELDPGAYVACPGGYGDGEEIDACIVPEGWIAESFAARNVPHLAFSGQTEWERYYMEIASQKGTLLFWLGIEDKNNPRPSDEKPYGMNTYGELGRWSLYSAHGEILLGSHNVNVVIGAHRDFSGLKQIRTNLDKDHRFAFPIHSSLEETVIVAVALAKKTNPSP